MTFAESTKYAIKTTWFDKVADKDREYVLFVYEDTREIEIFDVFKKNIFLKRCPYPELDMGSFYIGNAVLIHGRQHNIVGFANEYSAQRLSTKQEKTCALIKPHAYGAHPDIFVEVFGKIHQAGITVSRVQLSQLSSADAAQFYAEHVQKSFYPALEEMITAGPALVLELIGENCVQKWRDLLGPTDPQQGNGLRKKYGRSVTANAFHGSASPQDAQRELDIAFGMRPLCAQPGSATAVMVIEPTFNAQKGEILQDVFAAIERYQGLTVSGIHTCDPVATDIDELFKAYQGVIPNWRQYCDAFDDGMCIAIELTGSEDPVKAARDICGPFDPEIAKLLKPKSIRAVYGKDCVQNAIFVTDIPEEAEIHSDFWFRVQE